MASDESHSLPAPLVARIRAIAATLAEVEPKSDAEWIEGFASDWRPEREIMIWEVMALTYAAFIDGRTLALDVKREVLRVVLGKTFGEADEAVIATPSGALSREERSEIVARFKAAQRTLGLLDRHAQ